MSGIPGVNSAYADESPLFGGQRENAPFGAPWNLDFRTLYPVDSDGIRNHKQVQRWNQSPQEYATYQGFTQAYSARPGYGPDPWFNVDVQPAPLAIDNFGRDQYPHPHGQIGIADAAMPFMYLPDGLPYTFDMGAQLDSGQAIGPRQVFRPPPTINDQTAAVYAAGF